MSIYLIGSPKISTDRGFRKRCKTLTKIIAVLLETFIRALETL